MSSGQSEEKIVDARGDLRWSMTVESLAERKEFSQLWHFAKKTPPIWTVRIIKFLNKQNWRPAKEDEPDFFETISKFAGACNEFDLPLSGKRVPKVLNFQEKFCTARITSDGEYVCIVDRRGAFLKILRAEDLSSAGLIRLDNWKGQQTATLGFAVDSTGEKVAILFQNPRENKTGVRICSLDFGELIACSEITWDGSESGLQTPRIAFDPDGKYIVVLTGTEQIRVIGIDDLKVTTKFKNASPSIKKFSQSSITVSKSSSLTEWRWFGSRAIQTPLSRNLAISTGGKVIASTCVQYLLSWDFDEKVKEYCAGRFNDFREGRANFPKPEGRLKVGSFVIAPNGEFILYRTETDDLGIFDRQSGSNRCLAFSVSDGHTAVSGDGQCLAHASPRHRAIHINHLPDGRHLGTLSGLDQEIIVDLQITGGGTVIAMDSKGQLFKWEADGNGYAWPWSKSLVKITHQPCDESSVSLLREAQEMRRRRWLTLQEEKLLDLALLLMENRLNIDIEIDWSSSSLPGDDCNIEIEEIRDDEI